VRALFSLVAMPQVLVAFDGGFVRVDDFLDFLHHDFVPVAVAPEKPVKDGFQFRTGSRKEADEMVDEIITKNLSIPDIIDMRTKPVEVVKPKPLKPKKAKKGKSVKTKRKAKV